jgi:hypothetical protein
MRTAAIIQAPLAAPHRLAAMGRRQRQRGRVAVRAGSAQYRDAAGNELVLRDALTAPTRASYARVASGSDLPAGASREDAWQRAVEFLFERLAVSWTIAGAPAITAQRELLARLRVASPEERSWVRSCLREHCAEHFPDVDAP